MLAASEAQLRAACENGATDSATMEPLEEALAAGVPLALTRSVGGSVATAHLAASLAAWALRSKVDGAGRAYLYDTADGTQALHQFEHPKAVWCVRLSPSVTMMAVAGYDVASHPLAP